MATWLVPLSVAIWGMAPWVVPVSRCASHLLSVVSQPAMDLRGQTDELIYMRVVCVIAWCLLLPPNTAAPAAKSWWEILVAAAHIQLQADLSLTLLPVCSTGRGRGLNCGLLGQVKADLSRCCCLGAGGRAVPCASHPGVLQWRRTAPAASLTTACLL